MVAENSSVRRVFRRRVKQRFEFFAEAEVEHLVGFVEHGDLQRGKVEIAAREVIAEAAGRADDDMGAAGELLLFGADAHAADAARRCGRRCRHRAIRIRG